MRGWRNWSSLPSPEHHWLQHTRKGKSRQDISADGSRATLSMGKCWQGFLLDSRFLCWLTWLLIPPSGRFCGSTTLCNRSHAAGSWGDSLASLRRPGRLSGPKGSQHCLTAHSYLMAMAWLGLSESKLGTSQLWTGLFQQKLCSVKPLDCVSLAPFSQTKEMMELLEKKNIVMRAHSVPTNSSAKPALTKKQNLVLPMPICAGTISRAIPK